MKFRPPPTSAGAAANEAKGATDDQDARCPQGEVKQRKLQDEGAVLSGFIVARRTMGHTVAPEGRVDARVQLWAPVYTIFHDVASRWQHRASAKGLESCSEMLQSKSDSDVPKDVGRTHPL